MNANSALSRLTRAPLLTLLLLCLSNPSCAPDKAVSRDDTGGDGDSDGDGDQHGDGDRGDGDGDGDGDRGDGDGDSQGDGDADSQASDAGAPDAAQADRDASTPSDVPGCAAEQLSFTTGWQLESSEKTDAGGAKISRVGFDASSWHRARVPQTVLAALVADGTYPDPRVLDNHDRNPQDPFTHSWWYRHEFELPASYAGGALELTLEGVSYRANLWVNGELVADKDELVGTFVSHRFDVTEFVKPGERNALAIQVYRPDPQKNLSVNFHDWNPNAADHGMGLWRGVHLKKTSSVTVRAAYVLSDLDDALSSARLTVVAELVNMTADAVHTTVSAELDGHTLSQEVDLAAHEQKSVSFTPEQHGELNVQNPRVWWPAKLGEQPLYDLCVSADVSGARSDRHGVRFGIRETGSAIDAQGHRLFTFNGKPLFVRGAGWTSDLLLEPKSPARLDAELGYTLDLGINVLRMEGKLEDKAFFDRTDELGILTMPGWMCCDRWEKWDDWSAEDREVAVKSTASQAAFLASHPSVMAFFLASDFAPPDDIADAYQVALRAHGFSGTILPSAEHYETHDLKSGMKMTGPYDWVPPHYWYFPHNGGAFGFLTESSPGAAIPELESLRGMLTAGELDTLWRNPAAPQLHAGGRGSDFETLDEFGEALFARHGQATSLEDFVLKAQLMNYESERIPFEAYRHNKYAKSTGFIHWLLNSSWPSLIWTLYGFDLSPSAGYYGAKMGNAPVLMQYAFDDRVIRVINDTTENITNLHARVRVYNVDSTVRWEYQGDVAVGPDSVAQVTTLPSNIAGLSSAYFLAMSLTRDGEHVNDNVYWLSTKPDVLDWAGTDWRRTPSSSYGDLRALSQLQRVSVEASATSEQSGSQGITRVVVENKSNALAFFIRLKLTRGEGGEQVLPVYWEDNYITLEPGERREIAVRYDLSVLGAADPVVELRGFNVNAQSIDG